MATPAIGARVHARARLDMQWARAPKGDTGCPPVLPRADFAACTLFPYVLIDKICEHVARGTRVVAGCEIILYVGEKQTL